MFPPTWEQEFARAARCNLDAIEWLVSDEMRANPIFTASGRSRIRERARDSGTSVPSVCGHCFMHQRLVGVANDSSNANVTLLEELIRAAHDVGARTVLVPVLETAAIQSHAEAEELVARLARPLQLAERMGMTVGVETDLAIAEAIALVDKAGCSALGVYFDIGNVTAAGVDAVAGIVALGERLCGVHVKDRTIGGGTVRLGEGDADIAGCLRALSRVGYSGPLILEAQQGDDFIERATAYGNYVRRLMAAAGDVGA